MKVYCILNKVNLKRYIGSAEVFNRRRNYHFSKLRRNEHDNQHLQNSWNKYGEENFQFLILEENIEPTKLIEREQWWIDNTPSQYNICKIAGSCRGRKHSEETKKKISLYNSTLKTYSVETRAKISMSKLGVKRDSSKWNRIAETKSVYEYSTDNTFIRKWKSSKELAKHYNISTSYVWKCANENRLINKLNIKLSFNAI